MARPEEMSHCWTNEQRDCGSSRRFSVVWYVEPKMNLTTQIAKCIGSAHLRFIVWTTSKVVLRGNTHYFMEYLIFLLNLNILKLFWFWA